MKHHSFLTLAALLSATLLFSGCGGNGDAQTAEPMEAEDPLDEIAGEVPSSEELEAEAEVEVTSENADEVFEQLEDAIEAELAEEGGEG